MDVASYCYYEKGCRTNALLKYFYSFSTAELNNIEGEGEVFAQEFSCKESDFWDNCVAGSLSNKYVHSITAWQNTYLKNYSKTFNALILTPYSYPKQTTYCN